jgi:hypothetical protein
MEVDAMLCNYAEAEGGKLYVSGAGISLMWVGAQPPHVVNFFVGAVVQVPYTATNQPHRVTVRLEELDGPSVLPWVPDGHPDTPPPVVLENEFNVGRPPGIDPGEAQSVPLAFGFVGLPLSTVGSYTVVVEIDGTEMRRLPFRVLVPPPGR